MKEQYFLKKDGRIEMLLTGKDYKPLRTIGKKIGSKFCTDRTCDCIFRSVPGGGIGLPYRLMLMGFIDLVEVTFMPGGFVLRTSRASVLKFGKIRHYSRNGLERQIIMPIDDFGRERQREAEPTLFDEIQP